VKPLGARGQKTATRFAVTSIAPCTEASSLATQCEPLLVFASIDPVPVSAGSDVSRFATMPARSLAASRSFVISPSRSRTVAAKEVQDGGQVRVAPG